MHKPDPIQSDGVQLKIVIAVSSVAIEKINSDRSDGKFPYDYFLVQRGI